MTSEQKKAIEACKDRAAKEASVGFENFEHLLECVKRYGFEYWDHLKTIEDRAMQLYGEQCRELVVKLTAEDIAYMIASYPSESDFLLAEKIYEKLTAPGR